jgi:hypothetical protein
MQVNFESDYKQWLSAITKTRCHPERRENIREADVFSQSKDPYVRNVTLTVIASETRYWECPATALVM